MSDESTSPITHECSVRCTPQHAFATYTGRMSEWWDPRYTANAETLQSVTVEPYVGGRVYATHRDMGKHGHKRGRAKEVRGLAHHARPVHGARRLRPLSALTSRRGS